MQNNELKKVCTKNRTRYYFVDITKIEDFDLVIFYWMKNHTKIF